jgi:hypothetical protein
MARNLREVLRKHLPAIRVKLTLKGEIDPGLMQTEIHPADTRERRTEDQRMKPS